MNSLSIRLISIFIFIIFTIILLIWNDYTISAQMESRHHTLMKMKNFQVELLQMRRAEKDFFLRKELKYYNKFIALSHSMQKQLNEKSLKEDLKNYTQSFIKITHYIYEIGVDEDDGLRGKFREEAHNLESQYQQEDNQQNLLDLLQLRRDEKDFLLRKNIKYLLAQQQSFKTLRAKTTHKQFLKDLDNYQKIFLELTEKMKIIGLTEKLGLTLIMRDSAHKIENNLNGYISKSMPIMEEELDSLSNSKYYIYILLVVFFIVIFIIIIKPIYDSFLVFQHFFKNFKDAHERIDSNKLKFKELKSVAQTLNTMLRARESIEKDLIQSRDEAIKLQKVKEQFLTNMGHELRTPLNAVIGFSSILKVKLPSEAKNIEPILKSSQHLLNIINDILDISKIGSGTFIVNHDIFNFMQNLEITLNKFQTTIKSKNINFIVNSTIDNDFYFNGDWLRISKVISILLSNAFKFTYEEGRVSLEISFHKGVLTVIVTDNGIGISDRMQKKIFQAFEQADLSRTKEYGGVGLGLAISHAIAKIMNGKIGVESREGEGSRFIFEIEIERVDKPQEVVIEDDITEDSISAHILIVEDNKTNQLLLSILLDDVDITYEIANDGLEAVEMYEDGKYDIVLMDENMPNMNGVDAMLKIRAEHKNVVPIIAVTANVMKGDEQRLLDIGMDGFVPKPIDNDELIATIVSSLKA